MKKVALLLIFFSLAGILKSQEERLVLLEHFTQASCTPCAAANPGIKSICANNPDKLTSIWYHTSWPGYDPMNLHNPQDAAARVAYYNVTGVPRSVLDGNYYNGSATGWNINTVNARRQVPSPFNLQLKQEISSDQDSVYLTLVALASQAVAGSLVAHTAVIEKNIHFTNPPGSNGEKDFINVMKKLLPTSAGFTLPTSMGTGDYAIIETAWQFANVYNVSEIAAVSFVQNNATKEVHQSCNSISGAITLPYDNDLQVIAIGNLPYAACIGRISPLVTVRNNGNNTITSFTLKFSVNGGNESMVNWNGTLPSLGKVVIQIPEYSFSPSGNNQIKVFSTAPNAASDEYPKNDTLNTILKTGPGSTDVVYLFLRTDNAPQETSWEVKNSLGQVIRSGGPYTAPLTTYKDTINLPAADCYTFTIYDAGGNGLCCANGSGGYELSDNGGTAIRKNGGIFGDKEWVEWRLYPAVSLADHGQDPGLTLIPNPVYDQATAGFTLSTRSHVTLTLYNMVGIPVRTQDAGLLGEGEHQVRFTVSGLPQGLYIMRLQTGSQSWTKRMSVIR